MKQADEPHVKRDRTLSKPYISQSNDLRKTQNSSHFEDNNLKKPEILSAFDTSRRNFGRLKNGNPPGDPSKAPRCGAKSKRTQSSCRAPAMPNGRCRLHGGYSTGPKTPDGLERSRVANLKTGEHTAEARAQRREFAEFLRESRATLKQLSENV
jgi:hypothetical protein